MPRILVLSGSNRETQAYAKHLGVRPTAVQHAFGANNVRGVTLSEIHELPSFSSRRDKHSILAALRYLRQYGRSNRQLEHKTVDWEYVRSAPQIEGELPGQTTIDDELRRLAEEVYEETGNVEAKAIAEHGIEDEIVPPANSPIPGNEPPPSTTEKSDKPKRAPRKTAAKKVVAPKPGSNVLEPSSVDAFFQGS